MKFISKSATLRKKTNGQIFEFNFYFQDPAGRDKNSFGQKYLDVFDLCFKFFFSKSHKKNSWSFKLIRNAMWRGYSPSAGESFRLSGTNPVSVALSD